MIYRFRITLNGDETTFRDLEIEATDSFEDLHNAILQSFGFDGNEMASFYLTNEDWEPLEEITLFDMSEEEEEKKLTMQDSILGEIIHEEQPNLVYIYDFLNLWTFKVELADIVERDPFTDYPNLLFAQGQLDFNIESDSFLDEEADDPYDLNDEEEDSDFFDNLDDFDEFDEFDENWN